MREFSGTVFKSALDEVRALVAAARESGGQMYTVLNGVGLIADPRITDPDYPEQMIWTYEVAADPSQREVVGRRDFYQNLIPELIALKMHLMDELTRLDVQDEQALITWLARLAPVTWCTWALPDEEMPRVADQLPDSHNQLIRWAKQDLADPRFYRLNRAWLSSAHKWLAEQEGN